jgi:hypothetical protein
MAFESKEEMTTHWENYAEEHLKGRTIKAVRYMTEEEAKDWMWYKRPLIMILDDGTQLILSADDEGNDGGAMFGQKGDKSLTFPVLY